MWNKDSLRTISHSSTNMWLPNTDPSVCAVDDNGQKSIIFKDALGNPIAVSPENPFPVGLIPTNSGGDAINPSTLEKQDDMIALLTAIETNTEGGGGWAVWGATEAKQDVLNDLITTIAEQGDDGMMILSMIVKLLTPLSIVTSGSNRLSIDVQNVLGTIAQVTLVPTVTTVGAVNSVVNQANMGGLNAFDMQYNLGRMAYANAIGNFQ